MDNFQLIQKARRQIGQFALVPQGVRETLDGLARVLADQERRLRALESQKEKED